VGLDLFDAVRYKREESPVARLIKRYDNRKLYDTEAKRYVRLADIAALVRSGHEVQVIDNASGEDLTAQTLTKIIVEGEGGQRPLPPAELLHQVLRWGAQSAESGWAQLQRGITGAVERALERRGPLRELKDEIARLKRRLEELEASVSEIQKESADGRNDGGRDGER
jgi:polyhydroxyalkanoate synthesis repressor PhaR